MGFSWYWMFDVFEQFFVCFGKKVFDYYDLVCLDLFYSVFFGKDDVMNVFVKMVEFKQMFEFYELGSGV